MAHSLNYGSFVVVVVVVVVVACPCWTLWGSLGICRRNNNNVHLSSLIKALSAHMIHINLNMIFCTHVQPSPTKTVYIKYYTTQTTTNKTKQKLTKKNTTTTKNKNKN